MSSNAITRPPIACTVSVPFQQHGVASIPASPLVALMSGARNAMNIDLSKDMFDRMKKLFPHSTDPIVSASVLLANVYASSGDLEKASEIRRTLGQPGWKKKVGKSWTAVHGQLFVSGASMEKGMFDFHGSIGVSSTRSVASSLVGDPRRRGTHREATG